MLITIYHAESLIPFDLESTWSCAVVLLVTGMVDPSLLGKDEAWLQKTNTILEEMVSRGNLVAELRKAELQQLGETLTRLHSRPTAPLHAQGPAEPVFEAYPGGGYGARDAESTRSPTQFESLHDWNSEEGFNGDGLNAVADALDFTPPDWLSAIPLGQLEGFLY